MNPYGGCNSGTNLYQAKKSGLTFLDDFRSYLPNLFTRLVFFLLEGNLVVIKIWLNFPNICVCLIYVIQIAWS